MACAREVQLLLQHFVINSFQRVLPRAELGAIPASPEYGVFGLQAACRESQRLSQPGSMY